MKGPTKKPLTPALSRKGRGRKERAGRRGVVGDRDDERESGALPPQSKACGASKRSAGDSGPYLKLDAMAAGWRAAWSDPDTRTVSEWGREEVRMPGSALKASPDSDDHYNPDESPWNREPLDACHLESPVLVIVYVKPVQLGGSAAGEVALENWFVKAPGGDIAYYWETDQKAKTKWDSRFKKNLEASPAVAALLPRDRTEYKNGVIILPHLNFHMKGVVGKGNTASDSYQWEVLEEVHCWPAGKLKGAMGRTTRYQDKPHKIFIISNASVVDDQLHEALKASTHQHWEVKCPGCGLYHRMRTRWDDQHPELGGLRYDADGSRLGNGEYDYNKLESTIRFQMPCGHIVRPHETSVRRKMSENGRYSEPTNAGAHLTNRGYTLEAVAAHFISWRLLIEEKHQALQALRYRGDLEPWKRYVQERECEFFDEKKIPGTQRIELRTDRAGASEAVTPETAHRVMFVDKQQGKARRHEVAFYWAAIRDYWTDAETGRLKTRLVWAGKLLTKEEVEELRVAKGVNPLWVGVDCGFEQSLVLQMCAEYGYAAFKGYGDDTGSGERKLFPHHETVEEDGKQKRVTFRHIYSAGENYRAGHGNKDGTPGVFVLLVKFCKQSIRDRLQWVLNSPEVVEFESPTGAFQDMKGTQDAEMEATYRAHMEAEELVPNKRGLMVWKDFGRDVDLKVCELGCLLQAEMLGFVGASPEAAEERDDERPEASEGELTADRADDAD